MSTLAPSEVVSTVMPSPNSSEPSAVELDERRRLVARARRTWNAKRAQPIHRAASSGNSAPIVADPIDMMTCQLAVVNQQLAEVKQCMAALTSGDVTGRTTEPVPATTPSGTKAKGKNIDVRMWKLLTDDPQTAAWSSAEWAQSLGCAESTVRETRTWRERVALARAVFAAERIRHVDRSRVIKPGRRPDAESVED